MGEEGREKLAILETELWDKTYSHYSSPLGKKRKESYILDFSAFRQ